MTAISERPLNVLVLEHDPEGLQDLRASLQTAEHPPVEVEHVRELSDAMARLSEGGIDVVLMDLDLPDSQGVVSFERLYAFAPDVPIVVLTDDDDEDVALATVQGGAQDYLVRDEVGAPVVVRSLRYAVERHRLLSALRSLSLIDDLTGLYNGRGFMDLGEQYLKLAQRNARDVALVFLDLDRFRTINDTLGHHTGDRALIKVADILRATFRRSDVLGRLEADEFAVLALEASGEDAELLVSRIQERIGEFNETTREPYHLSATVGVTRHDGEGPADLDDMLRRARAEVVNAKRKWKDKVR